MRRVFLALTFSILVNIITLVYGLIFVKPYTYTYFVSLPTSISTDSEVKIVPLVSLEEAKILIEDHVAFKHIKDNLNKAGLRDLSSSQSSKHELFFEFSNNSSTPPDMAVSDLIAAINLFISPRIPVMIEKLDGREKLLLAQREEIIAGKSARPMKLLRIQQIDNEISNLVTQRKSILDTAKMRIMYFSSKQRPTLTIRELIASTIIGVLLSFIFFEYFGSRRLSLRVKI